MTCRQKIETGIVVASLALLLQACVPPHALSLRNFLDTDVVVTIHFGSMEQLDRWTYYNEGKLTVRKNVSNFNKTARRLFKDTISAVTIDSLTLEYKIPARSVAEFGSAWGVHYDKVVLSGGNFNKTFFPTGRYSVDNITGKKEDFLYNYKWLGNYFLDIKN